MSFLFLFRRVGEAVRITHKGEVLTIFVEQQPGQRVRAEFEGPQSFVIERGEVGAEMRREEARRPRSRPA